VADNWRADRTSYVQHPALLSLHHHSSPRVMESAIMGDRDDDYEEDEEDGGEDSEAEDEAVAAFEKKLDEVVQRRFVEEEEDEEGEDRMGDMMEYAEEEDDEDEDDDDDDDEDGEGQDGKRFGRRRRATAAQKGKQRIEGAGSRISELRTKASVPVLAIKRTREERASGVSLLFMSPPFRPLLGLSELWTPFGSVSPRTPCPRI